MERQPIKGLKVKYDGDIYDKILYISISNITEYNEFEVRFENMDNENSTTNINCMLKDIEITTI